jgi:uncharacterized damage-inducible protein DinB
MEGATMNTERFRVLYAYTDWANEQVLDAAAHLDVAAYTRDFGQSWRSVCGMLTHLLGVDLLWLQRWQGRSPSGLVGESEYPTFDALRPAWESIMSERRVFIGGLSDADLDAEVVYRSTKGVPRAEPLWQTLLHVANHTTDHRGHLTVMLTDLGHPPPPLDFIFYIRDHA